MFSLLAVIELYIFSHIAAKFESMIEILVMKWPYNQQKYTKLESTNANAVVCNVQYLTMAIKPRTSGTPGPRGPVSVECPV